MSEVSSVYEQMPKNIPRLHSDFVDVITQKGREYDQISGHKTDGNVLFLESPIAVRVLSEQFTSPDEDIVTGDIRFEIETGRLPEMGYVGLIMKYLGVDIEIQNNVTKELKQLTYVLVYVAVNNSYSALLQVDGNFVRDLDEDDVEKLVALLSCIEHEPSQKSEPMPSWW